MFVLKATVGASDNSVIARAACTKILAQRDKGLERELLRANRVGFYDPRRMLPQPVIMP